MNTASQGEAWSYNYKDKTTKKIPIHCKLCLHDDNDEFCSCNGRDDKFLEICDGGFEFDPYHLIGYLKEGESK